MEVNLFFKAVLKKNTERWLIGQVKKTILTPTFAGLAPSNSDPEIALDGKIYTTITYGNGPGYQGGNISEICQIRANVTAVELGESVKVNASQC